MFKIKVIVLCLLVLSLETNAKIYECKDCKIVVIKQEERVQLQRVLSETPMKCFSCEKYELNDPRRYYQYPQRWSK